VEEEHVRGLHAEGGDTSQQSTNSMAELLDTAEGSLPARGDMIEGTILGVSASEILIDIGGKSEGVVTARDLERLDAEFRQTLAVGDKVWAYVIRSEGAHGSALLSLSHAQTETDWCEANKQFEAGEIIEETVVGCNKGGLIVNLGQLRGFVPASQIVSMRLPRDSEAEQREQLLQQLVGKKLQLKIVELDQRRNRLILSERAAVREWRQSRKERLMDELREGDTRQGVVSSLCDFGAFVDLGGADGLIHLSELSWQRVSHPKQVLSVGQKVDVFVLEVDRGRNRIALSLKRLQAEPWSTVEQRYEIGQLVTGTITNLTEFGAFARLDENIEGLVHISELSEQRISHPREVVSEGQELTLRVIRIDIARQRLGLSLRRVSEEQYTDDFKNWEGADQLAGLDATEDGV
jgi:small subunit ribosomal protein S1